MGFKDYDVKFEGFNGAKSYNNKKAMKLGESVFYVDPELALVSYGDMDLAEQASAVSEASNTVTFTWDGGSSVYDDRAMVVVNDIEGGTACYDTAGAKRQMKRFAFELGHDFSGKSVHVYLAFVSEDRKRRSNSQYLGVIDAM